MRAMLLAVLASVSIVALAAPAMPGGPVEATGLRSIAGWLKAKGAEGYLAAEVADAMGIPRETGVELLAARQRGFRDDEVLRIAQMVEGEYLVFVVQSAGEVYFYLSTVREGLKKAFLSIPDRKLVVALERDEAQSGFQHEVAYWQDKVQ